FTAFYQAPGEGLGDAISRWNEWSGFGIPKFALLTIGTAALAVVSLVLAAIEMWREKEVPAAQAGGRSGQQPVARPDGGSAAAAEPADDLPAGAAQDLERPGVALDAPGRAEEPDDAAAHQPGGQA